MNTLSRHQNRNLFIYSVIFISVFCAYINYSTSLLYCDFVSFYVSGINYHACGNPYALNDAGIKGFLPLSPNLNPPIAIPFVQFITGIGDFHSAFLLWKIALLIFYGISIALVLYHTEISVDKVFWSFYSLGYSAIGYIWLHGQIQTLLFLSFVYVLFYHSKHPVGSGILMGFIVSVKPFFGLWILYLFLYKEYKLAMTTAISAILFFLLPMAIYGPQVYQYWLEAAGKGENIIHVGNNSLIAFFGRIQWPRVGYAVSMITMISIGFIIYRYRDYLSFTQVNALSILVILLCSPIAWTSYTLFLLPFLVKKPLDLYKTLSLWILLIPIGVIFLLSKSGHFGQLAFSSTHLGGILLLFISTLKEIKSIRSAPLESARES